MNRKPPARKESQGQYQQQEDDARWAAVLARDSRFDGSFIIAVATTGIYCRPSCPARHPARANVRFFATGADAGAAGFRPCKRCRPDGISPAARQAQLVAKACRTIETAETEPPLSALAAAAGLSPSHFQRVFKRIAGLSPKAYAQGARHRRVMDALPSSASVTEAVLEAGFSSSGRFGATSAQSLGMKPSDVRTGGPDQVIGFATGRCALGVVLVAATGKGVCAVLLGDDPATLERDLRQRFRAARLVEGDATLARRLDQVVALIETPGSIVVLPLDIAGTAFQHRVWQALRDIPPGRTASYAGIAKAIGRPDAARAVAGACAANPLAVLVPCHRVVRADGGLSGYRWGVARKRALLEREKKS